MVEGLAEPPLRGKHLGLMVRHLMTAAPIFSAFWGRHAQRLSYCEKVRVRRSFSARTECHTGCEQRQERIRSENCPPSWHRNFNGPLRILLYDIIIIARRARRLAWLKPIIVRGASIADKGSHHRRGADSLLGTVNAHGIDNVILLRQSPDARRGPDPRRSARGRHRSTRWAAARGAHREGLVHDGIELAFGGHRHRIDMSYRQDRGHLWRDRGERSSS